MLSYHKILSTKVQRPDAHFKHFLSLGSHQSPYQLDPILSFSKVWIYQHTRFSSLQKFNHDNQQQIETIVIPLNCQLRIDSTSTNQPVINPKNIERIQVENQESAKLQSFLFIRVKKSEKKQTDELENLPKIYNTNKLCIQQVNVQKAKHLEVKPGSFVFVHQGKFKVVQTSQVFLEQQVIYQAEGCKNILKMEAQYNSVVYVIASNK